jgi:aldose 1-epimerase
VIELRAGAVTATIVPELGARIGSLVVDGTDIIVRGGADDDVKLWGVYPMAPFAGRVRDGHFTHDGVDYELPLTLPPHAGHGTVYAAAWERTDDGRGGRAVAELSCPLGPNWPLGGTATQRFELREDSLRATLAVTAAERSMPAEVGWHPWFATRRPIELEAEAMYERGPDHLPTGELVKPGAPPWDDCFLNTRPVRFAVGSLDVVVTSDCDHTVVFDEMERGTAVEPQSGPPDAFNLQPRVLAPGERLQRSMTIAWQPAVGIRR